MMPQEVFLKVGSEEELRGLISQLRLGTEQALMECGMMLLDRYMCAIGPEKEKFIIAFGVPCHPPQMSCEVLIEKWHGEIQGRYATEVLVGNDTDSLWQNAKQYQQYFGVEEFGDFVGLVYKAVEWTVEYITCQKLIAVCDQDGSCEMLGGQLVYGGYTLYERIHNHNLPMQGTGPNRTILQPTVT